MSVHLLECAARTALPPSKKLVLMAFADSADQRTGIGLPGLEHVKAWASLQSDSHAKQLVRDLVEDGYLVKHRAGRKGRRAEYVVFPNGCCDLHQVGDASCHDIRPIGSAVPDPDALTEAAGPDPKTTPDIRGGNPAGLRVRSDRHYALLGSGKGPVGRTPSPTTRTNPPNPPASQGASVDPETAPAACPRHPTGIQPNCRGCRTTPRQAQADAAAARRARDRAQTQALIEADRQAKANAVPATAPEIRALVTNTRNTIRERRTLSGATTA